MSLVATYNLYEGFKKAYIECVEQVEKIDTDNAFSFEIIYAELSNDDIFEIPFSFEGLNSYEENEMLEYNMQVENEILKNYINKSQINMPSLVYI